MPAFPEAALPDTALGKLADYVHDGMSGTGESSLGPRDLDPFVVGLVVMGAIALIAFCLAVLYSGRRV